MPKKPKCPQCKRPGKKVSDRRYKCPIHGYFDDMPNEGGDYAANPAKRVERREELDEARKFNDRRMGRS